MPLKSRSQFREIKGNCGGATSTKHDPYLGHFKPRIVNNTWRVRVTAASRGDKRETSPTLSSFTEIFSKSSALAVSPVRTTIWEFEKLKYSRRTTSTSIWSSAANKTTTVPTTSFAFGNQHKHKRTPMKHSEPKALVPLQHCVLGTSEFFKHF